VRQQRRSVVGEVPLSNQDWPRWLEENERCFQEHLNSAYKLRRGLNVRVEPDGVMPHGPSMLAGQDDSLISSWHSLLQCSPPGFYCVDWGSQKCVLFHVGCRGTSLFLPLPGQGYLRDLVLPATMATMYVTTADLHCRLGCLVPPDVYHGPAPLYELRVCVESVSCAAMHLRIVGAVLVDPIVRSRRTAGSGDADNFDDFSDSDAEPVPASASDSEVESLVSSADIGVESEAEGSLHAAESLAETFPLRRRAGHRRCAGR